MGQILACCGGDHEPDPPDSYIDFRGYRFRPSFLCICCGKEICGRQFAFGRACGMCDVGACNSANRVYRIECAHEHPKWWHPDAQEMIDRFGEFTESEAITSDKVT